jgi:S1-C subfamily serine protease
LAEYFGVEEGVLVATVESNSVASAAGLQAGDIITAINAEAVDGPSTLRRHVATLEPGEAFTIEVTRDSREVEVDGQIEEARPRRLHRQQEEAI